MPYEVTVKEVAPQPVVSVRKHASLASVGTQIGAGFEELMAFVGERSISVTGPPLAIYEGGIGEGASADFELCFPVLAVVEADGAIASRELEGGRVATTIHRGPYPQVGSAYRAIAGWVQEEGHELAGPPREIYLNDPFEVAEEEILTEVDWPIR